MPVIGPSFVSLQVADLERSAAFYETHLGVVRQPGPPHAVVFDTRPIAFALRDPEPGVDLAAVAPHPGAGVAVWLHAPDAQEVHDRMAQAGVTIVTPPFDGPFGRTFVFADPDGHRLTLHSALGPGA